MHSLKTLQKKFVAQNVWKLFRKKAKIQWNVQLFKKMCIHLSQKVCCSKCIKIVLKDYENFIKPRFEKEKQAHAIRNCDKKCADCFESVEFVKMLCK